MYGKRKRSASRGRKYSKRRKGARGWSNRLQAPGYYNSTRRRPAFAGPTFSFFDGRLNQPDAVRVKVRSYISAFFTSSSGAFNSTSIRLNTLLHPFVNIGSSGHENPTLNNMCTLYDRYRVSFASLKLTLTPLTATASPQPHWVALGCWDNSVDTVAPTTANQMIEGKHCKFTYCPPQAGFTRPIIISMGVNMAEVVGQTLLQYSTSSNWEGVITSAAVPSDPNQVLSMWIAHQSADATNSNEIGVDIELIQYVTMYGRAPYG